MKVRTVSAILWFLVGWHVGAMLAWSFGVSPMLGPILAAATAALMVGDPRRRIWNVRIEKAIATAVPEGLPGPA